jgi:hypothetical protein
MAVSWSHAGLLSYPIAARLPGDNPPGTEGGILHLKSLEDALQLHAVKLTALVAVASRWGDSLNVPDLGIGETSESKVAHPAMISATFAAKSATWNGLVITSMPGGR